VQRFFQPLSPPWSQGPLGRSSFHYYYYWPQVGLSYIYEWEERNSDTWSALAQIEVERLDFWETVLAVVHNHIHWDVACYARTSPCYCLTDAVTVDKVQRDSRLNYENLQSTAISVSGLLHIDDVYH
jgi:hypothetical protein